MTKDREASACDPANEPEDNQYLRLDEFEDVRASLNLLIDCLEKCSDDPAYWKWAIISAHNALQSACVCILTRTDGIGALSNGSTNQLWEKLYGETNGQRNRDDDKIHIQSNLLRHSQTY